jgi:hypothetical protein
MAQRHRRNKEKSLITLTPDRDWRLQLASVHLPRQFHPRLVNGQVKIYLFPPQKTHSKVAKINDYVFSLFFAPRLHWKIFVNETCQ